MSEDTDRIQGRERAAGLLLIAAAAAALILANSAAADSFHHLLEGRFGPILPRLGQPTLHQWVADGLMAIFFLLVGLEVKREWLEGRLATPQARRLPILAAGAGMGVPALIFLIVVGFDATLARGWAIPAATDIAFAIGVLALLGPRAGPELKILLVTIAIVDDIGAVLIIAVAYTADLALVALAASAVIVAAMAVLSRAGVRALWPSLAGFLALWFAMLASGVHPTIAGVLAAFTVPLRSRDGGSPLKRLEHAIHPWVMFGVMPLFGLVSAGVAVGSIGAFAASLPLAVAAGLFVGKQFGVLGAIWLAVRSGLSVRPTGTTWAQLYGASLLCGIGFTMSLFIGALAFPANPELADAAKLGTLGGSLLSAITGFAVLRFTRAPRADEPAEREAAEIFADGQER